MIPKTFFSQLLASLAALVVICIAVFGFINLDYFRNFHLEAMRAAARREAKLIGEMIRFSGIGVPSPELDELCLDIRRSSESRITIIAADGQVLAESDGRRGLMDSHHDRPEVIQALDTGMGWSLRGSDTLESDMMYTALRFQQARTAPPLVIRVATPLSRVVF